MTSDYDYCAWAVSHPLKAGTPLHGTFGNYFAMTTAGRQLLADPSHLQGKPVLPSFSWAIPRAMPSSARSCRTAPWRYFPPAPPNYYFHALLMERDRASVIATIREFLPF